MVPSSFFKLFPNVSEEKVMQALALLSEFDQDLIKRKYGLCKNRCFKLNELCAFYNMSYITIKNHLSKNFQRISELLNEENLSATVLKNEMEDSQENKWIFNRDYINNIKNGTQLFQQHQYDKAEIEFLNLLKSDCLEEKHIAYFYLGKLYLQKKEYDIAKKYFEICFQNDPSSYDINIELGRLYMQIHEYSTSDFYFANCENFGIQRAQHLIERGQCNVINNQVELALDYFSEAIRRKPNSYIAHLEKGNILFEKGMLEEAKKCILECKIIYASYGSHKLLEGKVAFLENEKEKSERLFSEYIAFDELKKMDTKALLVGNFFHGINEKKLTLKYYKLIDEFQYISVLSIRHDMRHIGKHFASDDSKKFHCVFQKHFSLEELKEFIVDRKRAGIKDYYDVYQIYCKNVGTVINKDGTECVCDYLTICTIPFSKKIVNAFPSLKESFCIKKDVEKKETEEDLVVNPGLKKLIEKLPDTTNQVILLLRLGFIQNRSFQVEEIGNFLKIETAELMQRIKSSMDLLNMLSKSTSGSVLGETNLLKRTKNEEE